MSKLFNLKEWLTIADTAKHLSIVFEEEVTEADVLRLALDGELQLSVYFVNHVYARYGKVVGREDIEWDECPPALAEKIPGLSDKEKNNPVFIMKSLQIDDERFLNLAPEVSKIQGVWNLPMIGSEQLDVEHEYQNLTNGPAVTLINLGGTLVEGEDESICQLQESYDANEYTTGSTAQLETINSHILEHDIDVKKAQKLLKKHKEQRKEYHEKRKNKDNSEDYYPAGGLPVDSILVVRTNAVRKLELFLSQKDNQLYEPNPFTEKERNSMLKLILGMAISKYDYTPGAKRNSATGENNGSIFNDLLSLDMGLDSDTIRKFIKEAEDKFSENISTS